MSFPGRALNNVSKAQGQIIAANIVLIFLLSIITLPKFHYSEEPAPFNGDDEESPQGRSYRHYDSGAARL